MVDIAENKTMLEASSKRSMLIHESRSKDLETLNPQLHEHSTTSMFSHQAKPGSGHLSHMLKQLPRNSPTTMQQRSDIITQGSDSNAKKFGIDSRENMEPEANYQEAILPERYTMRTAVLSKRIPLLEVDINITPTLQKRIQIFRGDDIEGPTGVAKTFAQANNLTPAMEAQLRKMLMLQVQEAVEQLEAAAV